MRHKNGYKIIGAGIVVVLFCLSLVIRMPFLGRSFGDQDEWATAHALISLEILQSRGAARSLFRNIQTYPGEMNKHIQWVTTRVMDRDGVSYYTSYPPFALFLPYIIFSLFSLPFTIVNIEFLNLLLCGVSSIFLYLFLYDFIKSKRKISLSLIGVSYYIFLSINLWYFHKLYSWDILWHYFWIIEIYLLNKIIKETDANREARITSTIVLFSILNTITIFTEFQGLFFALGAGVFFLKESKNKPIYRKIVRLILVSSVLPLIVIFIQNSTIAGAGPYIKIMFYKIFVEYGTFGAHPQGGSFISVIENIRTHFSSPLALMTLLFILGLLKYKRGILLEIHPQQWTILGLVLLPTLLHAIILFPDFIVHAFTLLKFSIFISIFLPVLISTIIRDMKWITNIYLIMIFSVVLMSLVDSVGVYKTIYATQPNQDRYLKVGTTIAQGLKSDEVGFLNQLNCLNPQLIYFTKRNLQLAKSNEVARAWMIRHKRYKGKIFYVNESCDLVLRIEMVTAPQL